MISIDSEIQINIERTVSHYLNNLGYAAKNKDILKNFRDEKKSDEGIDAKERLIDDNANLSDV